MEKTDLRLTHLKLFCRAVSDMVIRPGLEKARERGLPEA